MIESKHGGITILSENMQEALNNQMNAELYSSYLYLSMAAYYRSIDLQGFAHWMHCQAKEELFHGIKLYNFINERGGKAIMKPIEGPPTEWNSPSAPIEHAYNHELKVTGLINDLVNLAIEEKDHATNNFLQWFVKEQVEEEASADEVVKKLKLTGGEGNGLFMLDQELAARLPIFTFPVAGSGGE
jgi:ferritin